MTLGRYVVPLVFFTWKRFWNQHRVGDGQEPDWLPVTGASPTQWLLDMLVPCFATCSNLHSNTALPAPCSCVHHSAYPRWRACAHMLQSQPAQLT